MKDELIEKFIDDNFAKDVFVKKEYLTSYLVHLEDKNNSTMDIMRMFDDIIVKIGDDYSSTYFYDVVQKVWFVRPTNQTCF